MAAAAPLTAAAAATVFKQLMTQLWSSVPSGVSSGPSLAQTPSEGAPPPAAVAAVDVHMSLADAAALCAAVHRACHANCDDSESVAQSLPLVKKLLTSFTQATIASSHTAPPENAATDHPERPASAPKTDAVPFRWLHKLLRHALGAWLHVAGITTNLGEHDANDNDHLLPHVALLEALRDCILDVEKAAAPLFPLANVQTIAGAAHVPVELMNFMTLKPQPTHAAIYDRHWAAITATANATKVHGPGGPPVLSEETFGKWFAAFMRFHYANVTEKRSAIACRRVYLDAVSPTGHMAFDAFRHTIENLAELHGSGADAVEVLRRFLLHLEASAARHTSADVWDAPAEPEPTPRLSDPMSHYLPADLDPVRAAARTLRGAANVANRILVTGPPSSGKSALAAAIAHQLGIPNVDVAVLALAASDDASDPLGRKVTSAVKESGSLPMDLQAALVARALALPRTRHLGYVIGDIPAFPAAALEAMDDFARQCSIVDPPQAVVEVTCDASIAGMWRTSSEASLADSLSKESNLRKAEADQVAAKAKAVAGKADRRAKRERRLERRAKIDAGELQATEEDAPDPVLDEPEEEEPPEVDETGTPLEPEQIASREAAKAAAIQRRKFIFDLSVAVAAARPRTTCDAEDGRTAADLTSLLSAYRIATDRDRLVRLSCVDLSDNTAAAAAFVARRLALQPSVAPVLPQLPAESTEGIESGPEGDAQLADLKLKSMMEAGVQLSAFQNNCPVTFFEHGVFVSGSWVFSCHYRNVAYCFTSQARLQSFVASPDRFLDMPYGLACQEPVLIMSNKCTVLNDAGIPADGLKDLLCESLNLTAMTLADYDGVWAAYLGETKRRGDILEARKTADAKAIAAREERKRKQREADAKKKKAGGAADKKPASKKAEKKVDEEDEKAPEETTTAAAADVSEQPIVVTTEARLAQDISTALRAKKRFPPVLVCADGTLLSDAALENLVKRNCLPPYAVLLENTKPVNPDEEAAEEAAPEDGDDAADDSAEAQPAPVDDDGAAVVPAAASVKAVKPFDPTDAKQYRKLIAKTLQTWTASSEDTSGTSPAAPAVFNMNLYSLDLTAAVATIAHHVSKLSVKCVPPQDGEELAVDPEVEPEDAADGAAAQQNPAVVPGKKAIHQFGSTLRFCPVSLMKRRTLVTGDPGVWLTYRGSRYLFSSLDALDQFKLCPSRYMPPAPTMHPRWQVPPPRFWIVGVSSSGKTTLAQYLTSTFGIPQFSLQPTFLRSVVAAATAPDGGWVGSLAIPSSVGTPHLKVAVDALARLQQADDDEVAKLKLKDVVAAAQAAREAAVEAGEDVDDLDEDEEAANAKALEFEPEDPEAKVERVAKTMREVAAGLMLHLEPFASKGWLVVGEPTAEAEAVHLLEVGAVPEAVVQLKLSQDSFVARKVAPELAKRNSEVTAKLAALKEKQLRKMKRARELELRRWRRRNIGADDVQEEEADPEEEEEAPQPATAESVKEDLAAAYDTEAGNLANVTGALPERRVAIVDVVADQGMECVQRVVQDLLGPSLSFRLSLLENPLVTTYDEAMELVARGAKDMSHFGMTDPVVLDDRRHGVPAPTSWRAAGRQIHGEEPPPPPPAAPEPKAEKVIRMVKTVNEEGEEVEVPEEVEEVPVESEEPPPADDEPEDDEPDQDLSPEELEEMTKALEAKKKKLADLKLPRACVVRNRVFFFDSDFTLMRFLKNPLYYWRLPPPEAAAAGSGAPQGSVFAVMEDPTSQELLQRGHRNMAHHLAHNLGAVYVDLSKLLRWGLDQKARLGDVAEACGKVIFSAGELADSDLARLLACRLCCVDVMRAGAVLHNLPRSVTEVVELQRASVAIHKVLQFAGRAFPAVAALDKQKRISHLMSAAPYGNAGLIAMVNEARVSQARRDALRLAQVLGYPARLHDTATPESVFQSQLSVFKEYCPRMWLRNEELVDVGSLRQFAVLHCGLVYHFSAAEYLEEFMKEPQRLTGEIPPAPQPIPTALPIRAASSAAKSIELFGCCPVVLYDTRHHKGLKGVTQPTAVLGLDALTVTYEGKFYKLSSQEALDRFLRRPWVFVRGAALPEPSKLPFDASKMSTISSEQYVQRTMYENIARALIDVESVRPKFPGLSAADSCLKFIGLHLKAHNVRNTVHRQEVYGRHFKDYVQRSTLYKDITLDAPSAESAPEAAAQFAQRCAAWDDVQDDPHVHLTYGKLRPATTH